MITVDERKPAVHTCQRSQPHTASYEIVECDSVISRIALHNDIQRVWT